MHQFSVAWRKKRLLKQVNNAIAQRARVVFCECLRRQAPSLLTMLDASHEVLHSQNGRTTKGGTARMRSCMLVRRNAVFRSCGCFGNKGL